MTTENTVDNIEQTRNTSRQMDSYQALADSLNSVAMAPHRLVDTFPVFAPRQRVTAS